MSKKLERRRLHTGWIERILHARVPILKFTIQGKSVHCHSQPAKGRSTVGGLPV